MAVERVLVANQFGAWPCWGKNGRSRPDEYNPTVSQIYHRHDYPRHIMPGEVEPYNSDWGASGNGTGWLHKGSGTDYGHSGYIMDHGKTGNGKGRSDAMV